MKTTSSEAEKREGMNAQWCVLKVLLEVVLSKEASKEVLLKALLF